MRLAARKLAQYEPGKLVPATVSAIANALRWAEMIKDEIDRRHPTNSAPQPGRYIRQQDKGCVHFWPFDGWGVPPGRSAIAEVYPALWNRTFPSDGRDADQQNAFAIAKWMQTADGEGSLERYFRPHLEPDERKKAEIEGCILGVS